MVGSTYWNKQVDQFVHSAKDEKIKADHLKLLFLVDTPEEVKTILEKLYSTEKERAAFLAEKVTEWDEKIDA